MFEQDYLMRMITQLIVAINRSIERAQGKKDSASAAVLLDEAVGTATDIDGSVLLTLAPESMASILAISSANTIIAEYIGHTLALSAHYWQAANDQDKADLRAAQAQAVARQFGFEIDMSTPAERSMQAFLEARQPKDRTQQEYHLQNRNLQE